MDFLKEIERRVLIHDGSKGYLLQKLGLKGGECGELWNLTNQDAVRHVYRSYLEAGADVLQTNTFPGNRIHLQKFGLGDKTYEINRQGARLAKETAGDKAFVSASIGPTGLLFEPSGELTYIKAYEIFCEQVRAVVDGGADIINFETFTDIAELRAAYFAARDATDLPVICSLAFENNGRTLMGTDPFTAVAVFRSLGADMVGANCSFGSEHMAGIIKSMHEAGGGYLSVKPNAGLPVVTDGCVSYNETPEHFADQAAEFINCGVRLIGGCCGTTPEFIRSLKARVSDIKPVPVGSRPLGIISSAVRHLCVHSMDVNNIYRLDAANDIGIFGALKKKDLTWVEDTALDLAAEGYDAVYVNIDCATEEGSMLTDVVDRLQWYIRDPIIIETADATALDKVLRVYRGIAGVVISDNTSAAVKATAEKFGSEIIPQELLNTTL